MTTLTVRGISRQAAAPAPSLLDVTFAVPSGRIAVLLGPPHSGKSALLRVLAGLDAPDAGEVSIDDEPVTALPPGRRGIGLVLHDLQLFAGRTVFDNIDFGLRAAKWDRRDRRARIEHLLERLGIPDSAERRVEELSAPARRRVAFARMLAPKPRVTLLDEPLDGLIDGERAALRVEITGLLHEEGCSAVLATTALADALAAAHDLLLIDLGRLTQAGPLADVVAYPATPEAATVLGWATLAWGEVERREVFEAGVGAVALPRGVGLEGRARVMAHPSTLLAVPEGRGLGCGVRGSVVAVRPEGPMHIVTIALGPRLVEARWEWDLVPPPLGLPVEVAARPETLRFFQLPAPTVEPFDTRPSLLQVEPLDAPDEAERRPD